MNIHRLIASALLSASLFATHPARAAESYDNCVGTVSSLPATISTQGVWCLKKDLSTNIASGDAITIATNNVTIDCNDFKLGGLAAGTASQAIGIDAVNRQNASIRHCGIRGFYIGIDLHGGGGGHMVEDNRLDNNLHTGIYVDGDTSVVRRNRIYDTGGSTGSDTSIGIDARAVIADNIVSGLFADQSDGVLQGIVSSGSGTRVSGNAVSGFNMTATQGGDVAEAVGINAHNLPMTVVGNILFGPASGASNDGILGDAYYYNFCAHNIVYGFSTAMVSCTDEGGNGLH
jgi:hypothetical protein